MKSKAQAGVVWPLWFLLFVGWVLLLSGVAAMQQNCSGANASAILQAGTVAYLSPTPCGKFYRFTWWITWYLFAIMIMFAVFAGARTFHLFRAGMLGLSAPLLVLLMDTCNTYFYFNGLALDSNTTKVRARVVFAGAIISSVALFALLLVVGIFDEEQGKAERRGGTGEPKGETYGGVYQPTAGQREAGEAATYAYAGPARE